MKEEADKEAIVKRVVEEVVMREAAVGVVGGSSTFDQAPSSAVGAKRAALGLAGSDMPQTPERVLEDVLEESEEELEMVLEPVPEVVPVEGVMIIAHTTAPSPPHGAAEASLPAPRAAVAMDVVARVVREPEVVMGHPPFMCRTTFP
jgi:hypothetical protein